MDPHFVLFSGHTRFNVRLPRPSILARYDSIPRRILRTDRHEQPDKDNIILTARADRSIDYQYMVRDGSKLRWEGRLASGVEVDDDFMARLSKWNRERLDRDRKTSGGDAANSAFSVGALQSADLTGLRLADSDFRQLDLTNTTLRAARISGDLTGSMLDGADLSYADLREATLADTHLSGAVLVDANLPDLRTLDLTKADLSYAHLEGSDLSGAILKDTKLAHTDLSGFRMVGGIFAPRTIQGARFTDAVFEPDPGAKVPEHELALAAGLETIKYDLSPHALIELREEAKSAGLRDQERNLTCAIERGRRRFFGWIEALFSYVAFDLTTEYGRRPGRALQILLITWALWGLVYYLVLRFGSRSGLRLVVTRRTRIDPSKFKVRIAPLRPLANAPGLWGRARTERHLVGTAVEYSLRSAFNLRFQWLEAGTWLRMLHRREFELEPFGWTRTFAGLQSLLSLYLVAIWILSYFGRPFG